MENQPRLSLRNFAALFLLLSVSVLLTRCKGHQAEGNFSAEYGHQLLSEYRFEPANLSSGTEITILAYSGGDREKKDGLNYCQFIGINKTNGDTVRILAAVVDIRDSDTATTPSYTPVLSFDMDKSMQEAIFETATEDQKNILKMVPSLDAGDLDEKKLGAHLDDTANVKEYVLIPEGQPLFARPFKTAVGVLRFKTKSR